MATQVLRQSKLWIRGYDFSGDMNSMSLEYGAELQDDTVFGDDTRSRKGGLKTVAFSHAGFWNADGTDEPDDILFARVGLGSDVMTVAPETGAAGEAAYILNAITGEYNVGAAVGEMLGFTVTGESQSNLVRGTIIHNASQTSTGSGSEYEVGAVASGEYLYAALHVLSVSGTDPTLTVKVQSDATGFASATDRITFTEATAVGAQWATPVAGAIADDFWRVNYTVGGTDTPTFEFVVTIGIL